MCDLIKEKAGKSEKDEQIRDLINQMVQINPSDRRSARKLLRHPLFEKYRIKNIKRQHFNRGYSETLKNFTVEDFKKIIDFETEF